MIKLTIDGKEVNVAEGTTVLKAAKQLGIEIPTMCYMQDDFHNHPSCMICLVKDAYSGKLLPSCALPASENMNIICTDEEVFGARKEALELLLSDHVGDCDAPCRLGCPAYMNIPLMNRLIADGEFEKAIAIVKEEIAIPHILGYICPAPCEKVCRRNTIDSPIQICQLKKFVAAKDLNSDAIHFPKKSKKSGKIIAIIGTGPAGLSTAFYVLKSGHGCVLFDKNEFAGGSLKYETLDKELPIDVLDSEINYLESFGAEFKLNTEITQSNFEDLQSNFDAVVLTSGSNSYKLFSGLARSEKGIKINPDTYETSIPAVFACGSSVRTIKMAVRSVAQGKGVAKSLNQFLKAEKIQKINRMFNSKFGKLSDDEYDEYLKEALNKSIQKKTYVSLEPYEIDKAIKEAERCMHCDCRKMDNCALRIHSDFYKADRKKYLLAERNKVTKIFKQDVIVYEPEKCIKCGLCVEISSLKKEEIGFTHIGRGFNVKIKAPFGKSIDVALTKTAIECANACPTGAISLIENI